jgi:hypothetical protein
LCPEEKRQASFVEETEAMMEHPTMHPCHLMNQQRATMSEVASLLASFAIRPKAVQKFEKADRKNQFNVDIFWVLSSKTNGKQTGQSGGQRTVRAGPCPKSQN